VLPPYILTCTEKADVAVYKHGQSWCSCL